MTIKFLREIEPLKQFNTWDEDENNEKKLRLNHFIILLVGMTVATVTFILL